MPDDDRERLLDQGWRVATVRECAIKGPKREDRLSGTVGALADWLRTSLPSFGRPLPASTLELENRQPAQTASFTPAPLCGILNTMQADIRWVQRFQNLTKAFLFLQAALDQKQLNPLERTGVIQAYEFTFELAWNTLKDYLTSEGVEASFPREVLKKAYQYGLIDDGDLWMDMLEKRNLMAHSYDEDRALTALGLIRNQYAPQFERLVAELEQKVASLG